MTADTGAESLEQQAFEAARSAMYNSQRRLAKARAPEHGLNGPRVPIFNEGRALHFHTQPPGVW